MSAGGTERSGSSPWPRMGGALADSLDLKALLLALAMLVLLRAGRAGLDMVFEGPGPFGLAGNLPEAGSLARQALDDRGAMWTRGVRGLGAPALQVLGPWVDALRIDEGGGAAGRWRAVAEGLMGLVLMTLFGGAIARVLVVRAADEVEGVGLLNAVGYAARRAGSLLAAPLGLMAAAILIAAPAALVGLLPAGVLGGLGFVPLLSGLGLSLIAVGLAAGWPLMVLTVAAEGEDGFDAVSRSFSYLGHRPIRFAALLSFAAVLGLLGVFVVDAAAWLVLHLGRWAASPGARDVAAAAELFRPGHPGAFWGRVVAWFVAAWPYSYLWAAFSRIYLTLRREVDGTPWDDFYRPEHEGSLDFLGGEPITPTPTGGGAVDNLEAG